MILNPRAQSFHHGEHRVRRDRCHKVWSPDVQGTVLVSVAWMSFGVNSKDGTYEHV